MKKIILTLSIFLTFITNVVEVNAKTINFDEVMQTSIDNSYSLNRSKINTKISEQKIKEAKSEYFPTISAYSNTEYVDDLTSGQSQITSVGNEVLLNSSQYQNSISLGASYNVFDFGARKRRLNIAKIDKKQKEIIYNQEFRDLKIQVATLYTEALILSKELNTRMKVLGIQAQLYKMNERLNASGNASKVDVVSQAVQIAELTSQINDVKNQYAKKLNELEYFTRESYEIDSVKLIDISQEDFIVPVSNKQGVVQLKAEVNQLVPELTPEYKIYEMEINKKQKEYEILKRSLLPKFQFDTRYYLYGTDKNNLFQAYGDLTDRSLTFRLSSSVPIFDGFKNKAQGEQLKLEIEQLKISRDETVSKLSNQFKQVNKDAEYSAIQLENSFKTLNIVEKNLNMIEKLNTSGLIDKTVYLKQKADLLNKQFDIEQNRLKNFIAQYELDLLKSSYSQQKKKGL